MTPDQIQALGAAVDQGVRTVLATLFIVGSVLGFKWMFNDMRHDIQRTAKNSDKLVEIFERIEKKLDDPRR